MNQKKKLISIVIPVYNEERNIEPLYRTIGSCLEPLLDRYDYEIVFTDNCSTDESFSILKRLYEHDQRVKVFRFSRNFGYQCSIYTAYTKTSGDAAIQMDCDFQDPPELIEKFIAKWEEGYQVVYGIRRTRKESWIMQILRKIFYRVIDFLSEIPLPKDAGDFRLIDRRVIDQIRASYDSQPYLRGMITTFGFRQIGIEYDRAERRDGVSKFTFAALFSLALDGIVNHSIVPLRIATFCGISISFLTLIGITVYSAGRFLLGKTWPAGFATTTVLILGGMSLNALFLGIIGEYLGRIYRQVKHPPISIIETALDKHE